MFFQFDDVGRTIESLFYVLMSCMQCQMHHLVPMAKEVHGHKKNTSNKPNTKTIGFKLDSLFKIRFEVDVLIIKYGSRNRC